MAPNAPAYDPHLLEAEAQTVWKGRRLPPTGGLFGPPDGPVIRQFEGSFTAQDALGLVVHRAVAADVDARYLALAGRRVVGTLRRVETSPNEAEPAVVPVLERLGVWTGGNGALPWDTEDRSRGVQTLIGRLAHRGVLVARDLPLRVCPSCSAPRSPERIIYQEEEGDTYLVRFDLPWEGQIVHALAWVDAPWRLLGTSALLLHPELPYVLARYRRKEVEELVLTSRSSLDRFRTWMPGATLEVVEEHPGKFFEGRPYIYPLRNEFPTGGTLAPPAGTMIAVTDVTDTGTGIVLLVPGHGSTDAAIAEAKRVAGWPLVTPRGQLDLTLMHKYAGLDLTTGNDFIVRDLTENGSVFARLRVRRGVPHCAVCGAALFWIPGRAWCLEPGRLPTDRLELFRRLLPGAPPLGRVEVAPWPVSETMRTTDADAVAILECSRCERLEALDGPVVCPCGGKRYPVRRRLVPSATGMLAAWARQDPIPVSDSVRLYAGERRRVPVVVHHLMAMSGLDGAVGEVGLTLLPTVTQPDFAALIETHGADAVRAAFVRTPSDAGATGTFAERCAQERGRLARFWSVAQEVLAMCDLAMLASVAPPVANFLSELEPEDRAILARWERTRVHALADYDHWAPAAVHRRVFRFLETDLAEYRELVRPRLALKGTPTTKRSALRTLTHVLRSASVVLGPILPHLSEAVHRRLTTGRASIFEGAFPGADRALLNEDLYAAWDRWRSVLTAVRRFRRASGLVPQTVLPAVALVLPADDAADRFRADRPVLERLAGIGRLDVGSPREPWVGRQRHLRPVESEIQRYYPSQASQIVHLLQRMPVRKVQAEGTATELSVVIQGLPRRIFPSMVEYSDTVPARMAPAPWPFGEMYLEIPAGAKPPARIAPPLSPDAFWLVRRLDRRLRSVPLDPSNPPRVAVVSAAEPLASELRGAAEAVSRYLGLREFRVLENVSEVPPPGRLSGRTRTGARWWAHVPGLQLPPRRSKRRPARPRSGRIPSGPPGLVPPETDYASEELLAHEQAVRALGLELDEILGAPLLGPTKIGRAWERGLTSVEEYRHAAFETLTDLPGFGRSIAGALVLKLGGTAPPSVYHAPRTVPPRVPPPDGHPAGPPPTPRPVSAASVAPVTVPERPPLEEVPPTLPAAQPAGEPSPAVSAPIPGEEPPTEAVPSIESHPSPEVTGVPAAEPLARAMAAPEAESAGPPISEKPEVEEVPGSEAPPAMEITLPEEESPLPPVTEPMATVPSLSEPPAQPPSPEAIVPESPPSEIPPTPAAPAGVVTTQAAEPAGGIPPEEPAQPPEPAAEIPTAPPLAPPPLPEPVEVEHPAVEATPPNPPAEPLPEVSPISEATQEAPPTESSQPSTPLAPELPPAEQAVEAGPVELTTLPPESPPIEGPPPEAVAGGELAPQAPAPAPAATEEVAETGPAETPGEGPPMPPATERPEAQSPAAEPPLKVPPIEPALPSEETPSEPAPPSEVIPPEPAPASEVTPPEPVAAEEVAPPEPAPLEEVSLPEPMPAVEAVPPEPTPPVEIAPAEPTPPQEAVEAETTLPISPEEATVPEESVPEALPEAPPTPPAESQGPEVEVLAAPPPPVEEIVPEPVPPPPEPPRSGIELEVGTSILASIQPFLDATAAGHRGVCVVRESPERITAQVGSRPVDVYWLTNLGRGKTLKPNDLPGLVNFLSRALVDDRVMAFFIEGIEYLVRIHGVEALLDRLASFDRLAREHDARVWMHVTSDLLSPSDFERIIATFGPKTGSG
jgi:tRNA synthetases class I (I, L, M and V)/Anticodon-binding domain of tRNA ligase/Protein of unknown function (DUF835)